MAELKISIHSQNPEPEKIRQVAQALADGAVILYPTDTGFSLGCQLSNKEAIARLRAIRQLPETKALTFLCESLSNIAEFAKVTNHAYRTIRHLVPGPYTFILPASRSVPRFAQDPKRQTAGIRVPKHKLACELLKEFGAPIVSISARSNNDTFSYPEEILDVLENQVDVVVSSSSYDFAGESTVIDMTTDEFAIVRPGAGMARALEFVDVHELA
jgi:tRNA threonylcarbamoyl adenosine modification protein (Sua5/YciO/YrdC/YwlC family)